MKCKRKGCDSTVPELDSMPFEKAMNYEFSTIGAWDNGYCSVICYKKEN